jgi:predicted Zn-dependent peptidase
MRNQASQKNRQVNIGDHWLVRKYLFFMHYKRTTLDNGLRLLTAPMPGMRSASIAFFFTVGSRYETRVNAGISHFIEHMLFKGTQQYPTARHISEAIEGIGGVFNGSTSKELTSYTARVPKDDPQEWVSLLIDETMWPDLPLGRDDAGFEDVVAQIERQQMLNYLNEYYRPNNMIISIAGNIDEAKVIDLVEKLFGDWEAGEQTPYEECLPPLDVNPVALINKETEQVNICLGTLGLSYASPDYYAFMLANANHPRRTGAGL